MAHSPADADLGGNARGEPAPGSPPGVPRWVKVFGIVAIVLVLLLGGLMLFGGGSHGPGRHGDAGAPSGALGGHTAPSDGGH